MVADRLLETLTFYEYLGTLLENIVSFVVPKLYFTFVVENSFSYASVVFSPLEVPSSPF